MRDTTIQVPNEAARALLELAAKAAAIKCKWDYSRGFTSYETSEMWNPLVSDADAMAIASALNMSISVDATGSRAWVGDYSADGSGVDEPYAALRFAIVRVAAQIGSDC